MPPALNQDAMRLAEEVVENILDWIIIDLDREDHSPQMPDSWSEYLSFLDDIFNPETLRNLTNF